jgi:phospholipase C
MQLRMIARVSILAPCSLAFVAGCSSFAPHPSSFDFAQDTAVRAPLARRAHALAAEHIKHVVVIIQENRSFESFFAGYPGANAPLSGYGKDRDGKRFVVPLKKTTFAQSVNLQHTWSAAMTDWDGGAMDGFSASAKHGAYVAYQYVNEKQVAPYWDIAQQYVLADEMFPTEFGPSYTAHLTVVAGTDNMNPTEAQADFPSGPQEGCDSPHDVQSTLVDQYRIIHFRIGPYPCFTEFRTMADTLDAANVSWRYYQSKIINAGIWAPFESIAYVREGPDYFNDVRAPPNSVLADIKHGDLAGVTWVTPIKEDSDHPGSGTDRGPSWVGTIVNEIGHSKFWASTAIVVVWDEWGGQYDNMPPPQRDFRGLGIRVPCLIISPYAKQNYVSHTMYEWGSILKFMEQVYGLPELGSAQDGYTDARANSIIDSFNFNQTPRAFKTIPTRYHKFDFMSESPAAIAEDVDDE